MSNTGYNLEEALKEVRRDLNAWINDESSDAEFIYNAKDKVEEILKNIS